MVLLFAGRLSAAVRAAAYMALSITLFTYDGGSHRVKIFHSQAFIDCAVDGDGDPNTCVSDFTVLPSFTFDAAYVFGGAFLAAAACAMHDIIKAPGPSRALYVESTVADALFGGGIAVVCGTQEVSTLALLVSISAILHGATYAHDQLVWGSPRRARPAPLYAAVFLAVTCIHWSVILVALWDYWARSSLPLYIPMLGVTGAAHALVTRLQHANFYSRVLPSLDPGTGADTESLHGSVITRSTPTLLQRISKTEPTLLAWHDSERHVANAVERVLVAALFLYGSARVDIDYE